MGAVASRHIISPELLKQIEDEAIKPSVAGLEKDEMNYRGFLYCGLILTKDGPKVLEYNCRFGDPEAQAVMPLLQGDFANFLLEAANGRIASDLLTVEDQWSVGLVLASAGYPASSRNGDVISGLDKLKGVDVYHAGTRREGEHYETNGGRVLAVVAKGAKREKARKNAYAALAKIKFDGMQHRNDIAQLHFEEPAKV